MKAKMSRFFLRFINSIKSDIIRAVSIVLCVGVLFVVCVSLISSLTDEVNSDDAVLPPSADTNQVRIGGVYYDRDLTELDLSDLMLSNADIAQLDRMTNLIHLRLDRNNISDLTPLAGLTSLRALYISENQISDLTPLNNLNSLEALDLRSNQISDISNLAGLTNLTYLHLDRNRINDISPIVDLTELTFLCLESNQIRDLTPIANMTKLTELYLTANLIDDITPLSNLTSLTLLLLGNNQINDLASLAELVKLETLVLQSNYVTDIAPLSGLVRLHTLYLQNNFISDFSYVSHVAVVNSENQNRAPVPVPILSTATDISQIPYIGNRDLFHLPAEHALAFAEAIRSAEVELECWTSDVCVCNFETLYPVLIDIYGDGVPLLLIAQRACRYLSPDRWFGFQVIYNLFAFQDGTFIRIDRDMNIATAFFQNENVLWLYSGYYGDWTGIYRVRNGTVEQIITFGSTWFADEDSTYRIDGIEVSADEFVELLERLNLRGCRRDLLTDIIGKHQTWSYGMVGSQGPFMLEYFTREQAAWIFEKYADSLG